MYSNVSKSSDLYSPDQEYSKSKSRVSHLTRAESAFEARKYRFDLCLNARRLFFWGGGGASQILRVCTARQHVLNQQYSDLVRTIVLISFQASVLVFGNVKTAAVGGQRSGAIVVLQSRKAVQAKQTITPGFGLVHIIIGMSVLIEKSRASCPRGRCVPRFIHQLLIITGLNKLSIYMFSP